MSPTPSWRSAVRRLLLITNHQGGYVFAQFSIPVRTSLLRPCLRKWMRDKASEGWLCRCVCSREKQVQQLQEFITPLEKSSMSSSADFRIAGSLVATHSHRRKSSRDPRRVQETYSASDRIRTERQEVRDHLRFREDEAAKGVKAAKIRLSETEFHTRLCVAEFHTGLLPEEQTNQMLSEARSEIITQEFRSEERSDCAIPELNRQIHFNRIEMYNTQQGYTHTHGEKKPGSKQNGNFENELIIMLVCRLFKKCKS